MHFILEILCPQLIMQLEEKDILFITYYHQGGAHTFDYHHRRPTNILRMSNPMHKRKYQYDKLKLLSRIDDHRT